MDMSANSQRKYKKSPKPITSKRKGYFYFRRKNLKPETKKSQQHQSSRRRNQPRKEYNFFNPQCKLLKKCNFRNFPDQLNYFQHTWIIVSTEPLSLNLELTSSTSTNQYRFKNHPISTPLSLANKFLVSNRSKTFTCRPPGEK